MSERKRQKRLLEDDTSKDDTFSSKELLTKIGSINSSIQEVSNNDPKIQKLKKDAQIIYDISLKEGYSKDNPNITRLARYLTEIQSKYEKIKIISSPNIKPKTFSVEEGSSVKISESSSDITLQQPSPVPSKIKEDISKQKEALLSTGKVLEEDINKYGIVGDYTDDYYKNWYKKEEGKYNDELLNFVAIYEAEYHKYYNDTYTPGQLAKTYNKIAESFIIKRCSECDPKAIIDYLKFIQENPQFALPTLLWIDTFHDFKEERLKKGKENLNKVIDYLCYKIYGHHWGGLDNGEAITDCVVIGHHYNFDKMYQNSFFEFNIGADKKPKVTGFHKDVIHTVLRPLVEATNFKGEYTKGTVANLLYNVSNAFINVKAENLNWEGDFLYAYLMYNFNFDMTKDGLIQDLRDVFWEQIKADKKEDYTIPFYAKDVDKGSSNFFKGTNVILPASLFDANRSNSSDKIGHFVPISNTVIPLCNGYNFEYHYSQDNCNLTLKYSSKVDNKIQSFDLCTDIFSNNSSCVNTKERDNYPDKIHEFIEELSAHKTTQKDHLKNIDSSISTLLSSIPPNYHDSVDDNILTNVKNSISAVYFEGKSKCVKIPNGQGMSPIDIVSVVIGLLIKAKDNIETLKKTDKKKKPQIQPSHPLSPISCKELDFWVALKRIGDFGQIMQCKQLGIPLFTNDNMQLLISMAACSSAVWTGDNAKVLWYDLNNDAILCNGLNPNLGREVCNKTRIGSNPVNITIKETLTILDNLPTEEDYKNIPGISGLTPNPVRDFLENKISIIPDIFDFVTKQQKNINVDELSQYIYLKIQEQGYLLQNNIEKLKTALFEELIHPRKIQELSKDEHINIQNENKFINSKFNAILDILVDKGTKILKGFPDLIKDLKIADSKKINELRQHLKSNINSQTYSDTINEQLLFEGDDKDNYIQDKETLLQTAAKNIESKYVDKLAELNNIRGGCIVEIEMKE